MYSIIDSDVNDATTDSGAGDAGVFVSVSAGNFDTDPITYQTNSYLGKTDYPFVGTTEMYPEVNLKVTGATSGTHPLGLTLYQTAKNDENGEKLLYNPQKATELQALLPGQAVPILTKGIVTLSQAAFEGSVTQACYTPGSGICMSHTNAGKITGVHRGHRRVASEHPFGHVLGTGNRSNVGITTDQFSGDYIVVSFNCA
tara:strand:+ start:236 stop:835 length:600 start_codon:yes stop_codon:yes gene_type:complete